MIRKPLLKVAAPTVKLVIAPCCTKKEPLLHTIDDATENVVMLLFCKLRDPLPSVKPPPTVKEERVALWMIRLSPTLKLDEAKP